jgi:hypothetical protein
MREAHDAQQVVDQYIAMWNETDPTRRRDLIAQTWSEAGRYLDPLMSGTGHDGIDAMVAGVQARGVDFGEIVDGRLEAITGFLDAAPGSNG